RGGRARLSLEALEHRDVVLKARGENLDRDTAAEAGVLRVVHRAHPATPEQAGNPVVADRLSDERFHAKPERYHAAARSYFEGSMTSATGVSSACTIR